LQHADERASRREANGTAHRGAVARGFEHMQLREADFARPL